jgi:hypothetical protein
VDHLLRLVLRRHAVADVRLDVGLDSSKLVGVILREDHGVLVGLRIVHSTASLGRSWNRHPEESVD